MLFHRYCNLGSWPARGAGLGGRPSLKVAKSVEVQASVLGHFVPAVAVASECLPAMLNLLPSAWKFRRAGTLDFATRKECLVPWGRRPAAQQPRCLLASLAAPRQSSWEGEEPTLHQQMQKSKIPKIKKKKKTKKQKPVNQKIQKSKNP